MVYMSNGTALGDRKRTTEVFPHTLRYIVIPLSIWRGPWRTSELGKLSIDRSIGKYQSLVNSSVVVDLDVLSHCFMA